MSSMDVSSLDFGVSLFGMTTLTDFGVDPVSLILRGYFLDAFLGADFLGAVFFLALTFLDATFLATGS
jgi:hypothetical protein